MKEYRYRYKYVEEVVRFTVNEKGKDEEIVYNIALKRIKMWIALRDEEEIK